MMTRRDFFSWALGALALLALPRGREGLLKLPRGPLSPGPRKILPLPRTLGAGEDLAG